MDNFTLSVQVLNGAQPPLPIIVYLDGPDYHMTFQRGHSFDTSFKLKEGDYRLTINGVNPSEGSTRATIGGNIIGTPVPGKTVNKNSPHYSMHFFFSIGPQII